MFVSLTYGGNPNYDRIPGMAYSSTSGNSSVTSNTLEYSFDDQNCATSNILADYCPVATLRSVPSVWAVEWWLESPKHWMAPREFRKPVKVSRAPAYRGRHEARHCPRRNWSRR